MLSKNLTSFLNAKWVLGSYRYYSEPGLSLFGPYMLLAGGNLAPHFVPASAIVNESECVPMMPEFLLPPSLRGRFKTASFIMNAVTAQVTTTVVSGTNSFYLSHPAIATMGSETTFIPPNTLFSMPEVTTGSANYRLRLCIFNSLTTASLSVSPGAAWGVIPDATKVSLRYSGGGVPTISLAGNSYINGSVDISYFSTSSIVEIMGTTGSPQVPTFTPYPFPLDVLFDQLGVSTVKQLISILAQVPLLANQDETVNTKFSFAAYTADLSDIAWYTANFVQVNTLAPFLTPARVIMTEQLANATLVGHRLFSVQVAQISSSLLSTSRLPVVFSNNQGRTILYTLQGLNVLPYVNPLASNSDLVTSISDQITSVQGLGRLTDGAKEVIL